MTEVNEIAYLCLQETAEGQASHAHVHEIIRGLRRRGWSVTLFEPDRASTAGTAKKLVAFYRTQKRLWRNLNQFALLYHRYHVLAFPSLLWARWRGVPVILEINGLSDDLVIAYPWTRWFVWPVRMLTRWSYRMADALIVVTPALKASVLEETGSKPVFVIPNGANTELFHPDAKTPKTLPRPYALFFGALASWQGIDTLLEAVKHPAWPCDVDLVVVGDGVERRRVEQAAAQQERIVYAGPLAYHDMPGVIANCLAAVIPKNSLGNRSRTGLFPLKLFESLACGRPVVVTDFPGQADLIREHRCGIVVPAESPQRLAEAVDWLHDRPDAREQMGKRGRQAVVQRHSWDHRAEQTAEVLLKVQADPKA